MFLPPFIMLFYHYDFFSYTPPYPHLSLSSAFLWAPCPSFPSFPFPSFISQPCVFPSPFGLFPETVRFLPSLFFFFLPPSSNSSSLPLHLHISWSTFRPLHQLPAAPPSPFPFRVRVLSLLQGMRLPHTHSQLSPPTLAVATPLSSSLLPPHWHSNPSRLYALRGRVWNSSSVRTHHLILLSVFLCRNHNFFSCNQRMQQGLQEMKFRSLV